MHERALEVQLQMPAEAGEPPAERDDVVDRCRCAEVAHEVKTGAAEAGGIEPAQLGFADRHRHERDADVGAVACRKRVLGHRIVEAVRVGLHDDAPLDAAVTNLS